jgi:hypothetical protein
MENGVVTVEEACQLHERAVALREHGQHAEAAMCARHSLVSFEREYGLDHPDVANILNNLAGICADRGDYTEAARLAQRAVAIMEQATGRPDLEMLRIQALRTLAGVYRAQGCYAEAEFTADGFSLLDVCWLGWPAATQQQVEGKRASQDVVFVELRGGYNALPPAVGSQRR